MKTSSQEIALMHSIKKDLLDDSYYILFRGDSGLPMGMLPVSPYTRRLLWQGFTLQEALNKCTWAVDSIYYQGAEELRFIKADLLRYTELNHFMNPFTSTTDNLRRAILYATRQRKTDQGYVSTLRIKRERCTHFREFVDTPATRAENEYGIDGLILPEEILLQIPIKAIDVQFYLSGKLRNSDAIAHFLSTYTQEKYAFHATDRQILSCPSCHEVFSDYLCEVLGFDSSALRLFVLPETKEAKNIHAVPHLSREEIQLEALTLHGMLVRCPNCMKYICLPEKLNSHPLEIIDQSYQKEAATLRMRSAADEPIWYIVLKSSYETSGKRITEYYYRDLHLHSEDLFLTETAGRSSMKTALYRVYRQAFNLAKKRMGGGIIQSGAEVTHTFHLGYNPAEKANFELIVYRLHFTSGKTWLSPVS